MEILLIRLRRWQTRQVVAARNRKKWTTTVSRVSITALIAAGIANDKKQRIEREIEGHHHAAGERTDNRPCSVQMAFDYHACRPTLKYSVAVREHSARP